MAKKEAASDQLTTGEYVFKWSKELTAEFIRLRGESEHLFTGAKFTARVGWRAILEKMGLQKKVTPLQAKKKWDNLKKKYKDCKYPGTGEGVSGKPTAATWPWFALMDEMLGPFTTPPVKIVSIPEDTPEPRAAAGGGQEEDDKDDKPCCRARRKREREKDELLDLIREDMKLQREMEERRAQESRERMDRLFSLLEKLIENK